MKPSALLQPETIIVDGHPLLVRTEMDEKIYYPRDPSKRMPFLRKMSGIRNGAYNYETIVFDEKGQAVYQRTLHKDSHDSGTWNNGAQSGTFVVLNNILTEYDVKKKIVRESTIDPVTHALSPARNTVKSKLPADIYTNTLAQDKLLTAFYQTKPRTGKLRATRKSGPVSEV